MNDGVVAMSRCAPAASTAVRKGNVPPFFIVAAARCAYPAAMRNIQNVLIVVFSITAIVAGRTEDAKVADPAALTKKIRPAVVQVAACDATGREIMHATGFF